jgi:prickle
MSHEEHHWHANNSCFSCHSCKSGLVGKPFLPRDRQIFCCHGCLKIDDEAAAGGRSVDENSFDESVKTASEKTVDEFFRLGSSTVSTTLSSRCRFDETPFRPKKFRTNFLPAYIYR